MRHKEALLAVSDVDDILFKSAEKHDEYLRFLAEFFGWDNIPKSSVFFSKGGSHAAYGHIKSYWRLNERMVASPEFNKDLDLVDGSVEALNMLASNLLLYLTTRPESLKNQTQQELEKACFPTREVIARPEKINILNTTPWKLGVLKELAQENQGSKIVMIDDSLSLHNAIKNLSNPRIETVLFAGSITPDHPDAKDWSEILEYWDNTLKNLNYSAK